VRRISKRVREEAALICAVAASSGDQQSYSFLEVQASLGVSSDAVGVGHKAIDVVIDTTAATPGPDMSRVDWAEAEALLRTGWTP
jgi:hypothetical protein